MGKVIKDLPFIDYVEMEGLNFSTLKHYKVSKKHARWEMMQDLDSQSLRIGHAFHALTLEVRKFVRQYARMKNKIDRRTTAGKQAWAKFLLKNQNKCVLTKDEYENARNMAKAVKHHKLANQILTETTGLNELTVTTEDDITGLTLKGRIDRLVQEWNGGAWIVDLKSTKEVPTSENIYYTIHKYMYHVQAAYYRDLINDVYPAERNCMLIFVQNQPPYDVVCYQIYEEALEQGQREYRRYIDAHHEAMTKQYWPGISTRLEYAAIPHWAYDQPDLTA